MLGSFKFEKESLKLKIHKRSLAQIIVLYFCVVLNASVLIRTGPVWLTYLILAVTIIIGMSYGINLLKKSFLVISLSVFLVNLIFLRLKYGGIGINYFIDFMINAVVALIAFEIDRDMAANRYIKVTTFLAISSLIGEVIALISPSIVYKLPSYYIAGISRPYYGSLLFSISGKALANANYEFYRNSGIYSEPGLFQMLLIPALYLLLFLDEKQLHMSNKEKVRAQLLILFTCFTTLSSTAYICTVILFICFLLQQNNRISKNRRKIVKGFSLIVGALIIDYFLRGNSSILDEFVFSKINAMGGIEGTGGALNSGNARLAMLVVSLKSFLNHPFGVGTTVFFSLLNKSGYPDAVGCGLFFYLAVLGIVGWGVIINYIIRPVWRNTDDKVIFWAFILIFAVSNFSQNYIFAAPFLFVSLIPIRKVDDNEYFVDV